MGHGVYFSGFSIALFAVIYAFCKWNPLLISDTLLSRIKVEVSVELTVASSWEKLIEKSAIEFKRIAVGVNGDVDVIVHGTSLLKQVDSSSNSTLVEHVDHAVLRNIQDLKETFGYFHQKGAGGERSMSNIQDFKYVLTAAKSLPDTQYFIGGNGALMAQKFSSIVSSDGQVLIGCPVGPMLKPLLNSSIQVTQSALIDQDEYHLILEYSKGERWDGVVAPIASRFIFSHDLGNSKMLQLEGLISSLDDFNPDLLVLSGFHMLEANDLSYAASRLSEISQVLHPLSRDLPIHVELASMSNKDFVKDLKTKILPFVDSIGLNEQELWLLCKVAGGPHCSTDSPDGPPPISEASDVATWLMKHLSGIPRSRLGRIHFHTLTYHLTVTLIDSRWRNQKWSVLAGTRIAANQACDDDAALHPEKFQLRISGKIQLTASDSSESISKRSEELRSESPVISWQNAGVALNLSPVLVCRKPVKTVGLGDAISATGLLYSGFV